MKVKKPRKYLTVNIESLEEGSGNDTRNAWLNCSIANGIVSNIRFRASLEEKQLIAKQLIILGNKLLATSRGDYD